MKKVIVCSIATLLAAMAGLAVAAPVDLSTWVPYNLNLPAGQGAANWVVSGDNLSVEQVVNADPAYFMNNLDQSEYQITGTWMCGTASDDDFIGFAFGWQDESKCYIMDWKENAQSAYGGLAEEGMSIKKLSAPSVDDLVLGDFWISAGTNHTQTLATNYGPGKGWTHDVEYGFTLDFAPGVFRVVVTEGEAVLWDVTVNDASYTSGQFGFYNFSQNQVVYSGFDQNTAPVCDAGGPYSGDAGVPVLFDGSASFDPDPDGAIVNWEWDFGDGATGAGETVAHTYAEDGEYLVTLCVTDDLGVTVCCQALEVVATESVSWSEIKSLYR